MKLFLVSIISCLLFLSCADKNHSEKAKKEPTTVSKSNNAGIQKEHYSNGQVKITGRLNNDGLKEGVWTSYFENGKKNSESNFKKGINNGYSMVWYPNGNVRYFGDYTNGNKSGSWTFYNEKGKVVKTESY